LSKRKNKFHYSPIKYVLQNMILFTKQKNSMACGCNCACKKEVKPAAKVAKKPVKKAAPKKK